MKKCILILATLASLLLVDSANAWERRRALLPFRRGADVVIVNQQPDVVIVNQQPDVVIARQRPPIIIDDRPAFFPARRYYSDDIIVPSSQQLVFINGRWRLR